MLKNNIITLNDIKILQCPLKDTLVTLEILANIEPFSKINQYIRSILSQYYFKINSNDIHHYIEMWNDIQNNHTWQGSLIDLSFTTNDMLPESLDPEMCKNIKIIDDIAKDEKTLDTKTIQTYLFEIIHRNNRTEKITNDGEINQNIETVMAQKIKQKLSQYLLKYWSYFYNKDIKIPMEENNGNKKRKISSKMDHKPIELFFPHSHISITDEQ